MFVFVDGISDTNVSYRVVTGSAMNFLQASPNTDTAQQLLSGVK